MKVTLNQAEQKLARYLARHRTQDCRGRGIVNLKMSAEPAEEVELEGVAAEIAFCKIFNVYPDTDTTAAKAEDCYTTRHGAVDVKVTKYRNGHLLAMKKTNPTPPDTYALMIGEFPTYTYVGSAPGSELLREENVKNFGRGEGYALEQGRLEGI